MHRLLKLVPEAIKQFDAVNEGDHVHGDVRATLPFYEDAFDTQIADSVTNQFDIASHHKFSPERVRLFRNGARAFPQYNSVAQFTDQPDVWTLQPDAGDTMHVESAESIAYVVNYVAQLSFAADINQELTDGDVLRMGPWNGEEGWIIEQRGADHGPREFDIIRYRDGVREQLIDEQLILPKPTTDWARYEVDYNWYQAGNQIWKQTFTDAGKQLNREVARTSNDNKRNGPQQANLNIRVEIKASADTTGLECNVGSIGGRIKGNATTIVRNKPQQVEVAIDGTADAWEPVYAVRIAPEDGVVNAQLRRVSALSYSSNATLQLVAVSFDESKTDIADADWRDPEFHDDFNSALEATTAVSQVANESGTVTDLAAGEDFGGYILASAIDIDGGNVSGTSQTVTQSIKQRKAILESDHVVFLAKTDTTGGTLWFEWDANQRW